MRFVLAVVPALALVFSLLAAPAVRSARLEGFNQDQKRMFKRADIEGKKARKAERKRMRRQMMTTDE